MSELYSQANFGTLYSQANMAAQYNQALTGAGQAQNSAAIREASLRNKADETAGHLSHAHALLDELNDALHGPAPRSMGVPTQEACDGPSKHPGLRQVVCATSEGAATLVSRLQTLLNSL